MESSGDSLIKIQKGSVFLLKEFTISQNADYLELTEICKICQENNLANNKYIIRIERITLIGIDKHVADSHNREDNVQVKTVSSDSKKISDLNLYMSKSDWSLAVCLSNISQVRDFQNRLTNDKGKCMRLQFYDQSGFIEAVFFNKFCDKWTKDEFKIGNCYIIKNADIKPSKKSLRSWHESLNSTYDLVINENTSIVRDDSIRIPSANEIRDKNKQDEQPEEKPKSSFITLNELHFKNNKSLVDTMAIVTQVHELTTI